jgi:lipid A 4'-phosphatase
MTQALAPASAPQKTPVLFIWTVALSSLAACVPLLWPALDLRAAALFAVPGAPLYGLDWWWLQPINDYIPSVFRYFLLAAAVAWVIALRLPRWASWRFALAFFVIAGVLVPGAVVNWGFKDNWQRARPYQVQNFGGTQQFTRAAVMTDQCDANCSFVSGHVSCGIFLASLALVHRRRQKLWTVLGVSSGLLIGFARMSDVAHWLSDVLWAYPITLVSSWLVWKAMLWFANRPARTSA